MSDNMLPPDYPTGPTNWLPPMPPVYSPPPPVARARAGWLAGWRVMLGAAFLAVFVVFAVLDLTHIVFPTLNTTTRPVVLNIQVPGSTPAAAHPDLQAAVPQTSLACGGAETLVLTDATTKPLQWSLDTVSSGLILGVGSASAGTLAGGQSVRLTIRSLGQAGANTLHFSDDQGESFDVAIQIHCP